MFCTSAGRFTESACMWKWSRRWLSDNYLCILFISTEAERFDQSSARALKFPSKQFHTTPTSFNLWVYFKLWGSFGTSEPRPYRPISSLCSDVSSQTCWASPMSVGIIQTTWSPVNTLIWEYIVSYEAAAFLYVLICIMARKWKGSS